MSRSNKSSTNKPSVAERLAGLADTLEQLRGVVHEGMAGAVSRAAGEAVGEAIRTVLGVSSAASPSEPVPRVYRPNADPGYYEDDYWREFDEYGPLRRPPAPPEPPPAERPQASVLRLAAVALGHGLAWWLERRLARRRLLAVLGLAGLAAHGLALPALLIGL